MRKPVHKTTIRLSILNFTSKMLAILAIFTHRSGLRIVGSREPEGLLFVLDVHSLLRKFFKAADMSMRGLVVLLLLGMLLPAGAAAMESAAACVDAAAEAERNWTLPPDLIGAIGRVESGRVDRLTGHIAPWPWTVNANGSGSYFSTQTEAVAFVRDLQSRGVQLIDVGCFQVDLFYHPSAFRSLEEAFNPNTNADYAARFLTSLHAQTGNWLAAVARYHSGLLSEGRAYMFRVMSQWQMASIPEPGNGESDDPPTRVRHPVRGPGRVREPALDRYVVLMSAAAQEIHIFGPSPGHKQIVVTGH